MHLKIYKYIFLVIIILASACYQEQEKSGSSREDKASIPVKAEILKEQEYKVIIEGIGKIDSKHRATLIFESQGQLEKIYKKLGDKITRGDVIAEINSSVYQSTYKLAEASYEKAKSDLKDARTLLDKNAISNEEFNQLSLIKISAQSNFIQARERFEKCSLTAPFDGTIVDMNLNIGELGTDFSCLINRHSFVKISSIFEFLGNLVRFRIMEYGYWFRRKKNVLNIHNHKQEVLKHSRAR